MNNKGQTLVTFIIIIPIILVLVAIVIDNGLIIKEKNKLHNISLTIIDELNNHQNKEEIKTKIIDLYEKNNINPDNIKIEEDDYAININISYQIESIFGKIVNIKDYKIKDTFTIDSLKNRGQNEE